MRVVSSQTSESVHADSEPLRAVNGPVRGRHAFKQARSGAGLLDRPDPCNLPVRTAVDPLLVCIWWADTSSPLAISLYCRPASLYSLRGPGHYCTDGFFAGFRSGYIVCTDEGEYDSAAMVPLALMLLYSFALPRSFSIDLTLSGGFSYNSLEGTGVSREGYGPLLMGGVYFGYTVHDSVRLVLGAESGVVFERRDQVFIAANGGFMFSFP